MILKKKITLFLNDPTLTYLTFKVVTLVLKNRPPSTVRIFNRKMSLNDHLSFVILVRDQGMGEDGDQPEGHEAQQAPDRRRPPQGRRNHPTKVPDRNRSRLLRVIVPPDKIPDRYLRD